MEYMELEEPFSRQQALDLAWTVFQEFEVPEYSPEGVKAFWDSIHDPAYTDVLRCYGAFEGGQLVGMLATRSEGRHIALFFVRGDCHRQGVGRQLFEMARRNNPTPEMTVNASPYAVEVYHRLGFQDLLPEQLKDGIRFTPMVCRM
jgi:GNAT superfamily N-acetyltransferase